MSGATLHAAGPVRPAAPGPVTAAWPALGTTAELAVTDPALLAGARGLLAGELAGLDAACSIYRPDSELLAVNAAAAAGHPVPVSPLLAEAISAALRAARQTNGAVDPTGGARTLAGPAAAGRDPAGLGVTVRACTSWRQVELDTGLGLLTLPAGTWLDPSATTWAWAADRSAARISGRLGCGVLISLGGDVVAAGPAPAGGWRIGVDGSTVAITGGGLATSGPGAARWQHGGGVLAAILRPRHGTLMPALWWMASVTAASCAEASAAATAAIIKGHDAEGWLASQGLPARLASVHGTVRLVSGWPRPEALAAA